MKIPTLTTEAILSEVIQEVGFLPYFASRLHGLSIEEHTRYEQWMGDEFGPWDWKGPLLRAGGCVYGKFFGNKAGFISTNWFPDFANYRRDGYDFDARYDEGLAPFRDKELYDLIETHGPALSKQLKELGDYRKGGKSGFETRITHLQMQTYVVISDFVYQTDQYGQPYGWGIAKYATAEQFLKETFTDTVYQRTPEESKQRIAQHLKQLLPEESEAAILKFIG